MEVDTLNTIDNQLRKHAIGRTIRILKEFADSMSDTIAIDKLNSIDDSYRYLRQYFMSGIPDPHRPEMLQDLSEKLRNIRDRLLRQMHKQDSGAYYAAWRLLELQGHNIDNLLKQYREVMAQITLSELIDNTTQSATRQRYDLLDSIFMSVMVSHQDRHTSASVRETVFNADTDDTLRLQLIYAVTLGLAAAYDTDKVDLLLDIALSDSVPVPTLAVANIGLTTAFMAYPDRFVSDRNIADKLGALADNPECVSRLRSVIKAIAGTSDTERVSNKMKDEVIPELMKMRPEILDRMKGLTPDMLDSESIENNPDWQEMLDKSGITRKLEELSEMMSEGADLMMVTFSQLKTFPFFRRINNWFIPFDHNNPDLRLSDDDRNFMERMSSVSDYICDSDKYSLALAMAQTPAPQRQMMMSQFNAQFEQMQQQFRDKLPDSSRPDFDREVIKGVREIYRYIFLARNTECFYNLFKNGLDFPTFPIVGEKLADTDFMTVMAEYNMKHEQYREALALFERLAAITPADSAIWQKIGFCRQKNGNFSGARQAYMKSELLGDDSKWLIRKLAFVNRKLGDFANALEYYERLLEADPENVRLLLNAANTAIETGNVDKALKFFYHADYLRAGDTDILRGLAWAELLAGHFDKADKYYAILTSGNPISSDWLNAGHTAHLQGQFNDAAYRYHQAAIGGKADFEVAYTADIPTLRRLGAAEDSISLLLDEILS